MDSSDEDSDDEPPPLLTRDLLMESSSSESESEKLVIASPARQGVERDLAHVSSKEQITWCMSDSDGDSTVSGAMRIGGPDFTETMWDEMVPGELFGEANCGRMSDNFDEDSVSERSRQSEDMENPFRRGPWAVAGGFETDSDDSLRDGSSMPPLTIARFPCGYSSSSSDSDLESLGGTSRCR
jgi:hypothetical protein